MKKINRLFTLAILMTGGALCSAQDVPLKQQITEGTILHAWCWSFKTIEANLERIKAAGYSALQTSPINECVVGDYGELNFMSNDTTGKWYYHYQPTDWTIGNYQLGTRDEFISMCRKADQLGIGVIVDVLPNHTTGRINFKTKELEVNPNFIQAVGGLDNLYHENNKHGIDNWNNREQIVNYQMGGLPDVNTENPLFQEYFMRFMNDCIDNGVDGFRFDTAKHIALPDDPLDPKSRVNNFWPVFTGQEPLNGEYMHNKDNLFLYGEVLQGGASREEDYAKIFRVTASSFGGTLRYNLSKNRLSAAGLKDFKHPAGGDRLVTWVESHDTYANEGESAKLTNWQLRAGWAVVAGRQYGTPLFFNRPQGKEATQFPGASKIGDIGNNEFEHPEVVAVNNFRKAMAGLPDEFININGMENFCIKRGSKGYLFVNMSETQHLAVNMETQLPDGTYLDKAHNSKFTVKNGILKGHVRKQSIVVIY